MKRVAITCSVLLAISAQGEVASSDKAPVRTPAGVRSELKSLQRQAAALPPGKRSSAAWANLNTAVVRARFLLDSYFDSAAVIAKAAEEVGWARDALGQLTGQVKSEVSRGLRGEGYYSSNDGSFQPFLRYLPPQYKGRKMPLVVFLHGYSPYMDIVTWEHIPESLVDFARDKGFCIVAPFGRSNTDFQGIGEQDVMRVIKEMQSRYTIDPDRIILSGISMGGMGVWTIAAHHPGPFAGLLVVSGRGDYYFWQDVKRADLPRYKQRLIDVEFGYSLLDRFKHIPTFCIHGTDDPLIPVSEARHMVAALREARTDLKYVELEGADHWIYEEVFARTDIRKWIAGCRRGAARPVPKPAVGRPMQPVKSAFLSPFLFVLAAPREDSAAAERFREAAIDWYRFAKAYPRITYEAGSKTGELAKFNVFLFGEPEKSALIRKALTGSPVRIDGDSYVVGSKRFKRKGNGLYLVRPSPWNPQKVVVIQCGEPWGHGLPSNHKYDFLPEYIVYSDKRDRDGSNTALSAGFFNEEWQLAPVPPPRLKAVSETRTNHEIVGVLDP